MRRKIAVFVILCLWCNVAGVFAQGKKTGMAISNSNSATIIWSTNEPSTSEVEYGENNYNVVVGQDVNFTTYHKVVITGLKSDRIYHYRVKSRDAAGNEAVSQDFTFKTLAVADRTAPVISTVQTISDEEAQDIVVAGAPASVSAQPETRPSKLVKKETPVEKALIERGGLLLRKGQLQIEPSYSYAHISANRIAITGFTILPVLVVGEISSEKVKRDIFIGSLTSRYGLLNNLQCEIKVPYRYQHDRVVTTTSVETMRHLSGIGDVEGGIYSQLAYEKDWRPDLIGGLSVKSRTGKSPYGRDIGLGTGHWGVKASMMAVKTADPAIVFGGLGYTWNMERNIGGYGKIDPGDTISYNLGCAFALNYQMGLNFQLEQSVTSKMILDGASVPDSFTNVVNFKYGVTWSISKNLSCDVSASHGITEDAPNFVIEVRFPYTF